jgi:ATPase subunit of ABC transporter with duplicated ATPase domains
VLYVAQDPPAGEIAATIDAIRGLAPDARGRTMSLIAALGADPSRVLASGAPSPGEARKVAIALGLALGAHALVLDEPTNHLDLPSIERLEHALAAYPGALLLVTHDDRLAAALTTRTWSVAEGTVR